MSEASLLSPWKTSSTILQFIREKEIDEPHDCLGSLPREKFLTAVQRARVSGKCSSPSELRWQKSEFGAAEIAHLCRVRHQKGGSRIWRAWEYKSLYRSSLRSPWLMMDCTCTGRDHMGEQLLQGWCGIKTHYINQRWGTREVWPRQSGEAALATPPQPGNPAETPDRPEESTMSIRKDLLEAGLEKPSLKKCGYGIPPSWKVLRNTLSFTRICSNRA